MSYPNPIDFAGRVAIVTGGTKGIGFVIAEHLLQAGATVIVCGRNEPEALPTVDGRSAEFRALDVRDADAAKAMVDEVAATHGRLDVLVNNAGGSPDADAATVSPRFVDAIVKLNLLAPFYLAQAANAVMQQQEDGGSIVNIGSVSAHDPQPGTAAYSAAKAGLLMLSNSLALEWAPKVRVNHITTGLIMTEAAASGYGENGGAALSKIIPMKRMAVPADVAKTCLFLSSDLGAYLNGVDIAVHGGGEYPGRFLLTRDQGE
ncbi:SDR family oxidoreductase [Tomitella biformata]|uniref:SDR family oxidoreductase n=1 Tax=Tomitella biformata TaxID=630403 RepID=UPI000466776A|nr:SDR family oxidoreductase [Tomitella biformata]